MARYTSSGPGRPQIDAGRAIALVLPLFMALVAAFLLPSQAEASEPFRIDFEENEIVIGPVRDIPIQQITRASAIEGTVDSEGRVTVPKGKFTLPVFGIDDPIRVRAFMGIEDEATGTWDPRTGKLEIQAKAGIWLALDIAAAVSFAQQAGLDLGSLSQIIRLVGSFGDLTCGFSPMNLTFTTESTPQGAGQRFTRGLNGPGALTASWSRLGPFAGRSGSGGFLDINPIACPLLRAALPGLISGSLQGILPAELDLGDLDIASLLNNLDAVDLGPSSITVSRTADASIPASLRMSKLRKPIRLKAGRTARVPIRVSNPGDVAATRVKACPRLPRGSRTSGRCVSLGTVGPGKTVSKSLVLRAARPKKSRSKKKRKVARARSVRLEIVVTGSGLPTHKSGIVLRVIG